MSNSASVDKRISLWYNGTMNRIGISGVNGAVLDRVLRGEVIHLEHYRRPVAVIVRRPISLSEVDELARQLKRLVEQERRG